MTTAIRPQITRHAAARATGIFLLVLSTMALAQFSGGDGTAGTPYRITTLAQLQAVKDNLASHFILMNDIEAADTVTWNGGAGFEPIGAFPSGGFTGTFNGQGHRITNLTINRPSRSSGVGLFGFAFTGCVIENLGLEGGTVSGSQYVGGLVGLNDGTVSISYAAGTVSGQAQVGGLVGDNQDTVSNCYATGTVNGQVYVGGLMGVNEGGTVSDSYATGAVTGTTDVGGLVGLAFQGTVSESFYDQQTTGQSDTGKGTPKTTAQMRQQATFTNWDFQGTWRIVETQTYPSLAWASTPPVTRYYRDNDADGYGQADDFQDLTAPQGAYSATQPGDCNDAFAAIHPGATEIANGIDDDCNAVVDDVVQQGIYHAAADRPDDSGDGLSWATAKKTVQAAIDACSDAGGSQVWVKAGTYNPTLDTSGNASPADPRTKTFTLKSRMAVYGGFAGTETLLAQRNIAAYPTLLSGDLDGDDVGFANNGDNAYHVVYADGVTDTVLDGFTVTAGNASLDTDPSNYGNGGGIYCTAVNGTNTLANCTVSGNRARYYGGGVYCQASSSLTLTHCTVNGNSAYFGGGVACYSSSPTLVDCTVSSNTVGQGLGDGGGIFCHYSASPVLTHCTLSDNSAGLGGGVYCYTDSSPTLTACTLSGNSATNGGGVYCHTSSAPALTNCTLNGNSASNGGGVFCFTSAPTLTNCTLSGNRATTYGGGVLCESSSPTLTNCILHGSTAPAVYEHDAAADPVLINCLFFDNPDGAYSDNDTSSIRTGVEVNALNPPGTNIGNLIGDPKFVDANGGDFHLLPGSAAIDAGTTANAPVTDADGQGRPLGASWDIGAYEAAASLPALTVACADAITVVAPADSGAVVSYAAPVPAGGVAPVTVTSTPGSGSLFPIGVTPVVCTASDAGGQTAECRFDVTVEPPLAPGFEMFFMQALLPPTQGLLVGVAPWQAQFANGVVLRNLRLHAFTAGFTPPAAGASETQDIGCEALLNLSLDGGASFQPAHGTAQMTMRITDRTEANGVRFFDTEILQLDLAGGNLPDGTLLRESPALPSQGQTTVRPVSGGCLISSFFDVFTEISVDSGQNWQPANASWRVELLSEPPPEATLAAPTPLWPSPMSQYVSAPQQTVDFLTNPWVLAGMRLTLFSASALPPVPGTVQTQPVDAIMDLQFSEDGGNTFQKLRGACSLVLQSTGADSGANGPPAIPIEMMSLNFEPIAHEPILLRESPTLPSRGTALVQAQPDGAYRIQSFFDIFVELSMDGGETWSAANAPLRLEAIPVAMPAPYPTSDLPPVGSVYADQAPVFGAFPNGVQIRNLKLHGAVPPIPLPAPGNSRTDELNSFVDLELSTDGGQTWQHRACAAPTILRLSSSSMDSGNTRYVDTEMLSLNLTGGTLPPGTMIRESPTRASTGRTSVTGTPTGGPFQIDSFFDVWTELSTDGGQTWLPTDSGPGTLRLEPIQALTVTCPVDITVEAPATSGAVVSYAAPVAEGGCAPVTVSSVPPSGSLFPVGVTTVVCTASDACGQTAECRFTVTVEAPLIISDLSPGTPTGTGTASVTVAGPTLVTEDTTVQFGVTASGGDAPYHYRWTLAGSEAPGAGDSATYAYHPDFAAVRHPDSSQDRALACAVTDAGGHPAALATWQTLRVMDVDRPPPRPLIAIDPEGPQTLDDLLARVLTAPTDPDGDSITGYSYTWDNPADGGSIEGNPLSHTHTRKGQSWRVTVRARTNPYQTGEAESSNASTVDTMIDNTPPEAISPWGLVVGQNGSLDLQVGGLDPDADDGVDTLHFAVENTPAHGTLYAFDAAAGTATYLPEAGFTGNDGFTFLVKDGTDESMVAEVPIYVSGGWLVSLSATNSGTPGVQFGVESGATPDFDERFDRMVPPAGPAGGFGYTAFVNEANPLIDDLERDVRGTAEGTRWLLAVVSGDAPVLLSWDHEILPDRVPLLLWEVAQPNSSAPPLPGTTVDMDATRQLEVLAPQPRYFVIAPPDSFELQLRQGWSLISLPIEPTNPSVTAVFAQSALRAGAAAPPDFRDGKRGVIYAGDIWTWDPNATPPAYVSVQTLEGCKGYWLYAPSAVIITVHGRMMETAGLELPAGWSCVGAPREMDAPGSPLIQPPAWWWDGVNYRSAPRLYTGLGYWFFSAHGGTWEFAR